MNALEFLEKAGETALSIAFPSVAGPIIAGVNALLPDDKKLPDQQATGNDVKNAVQALPPDQQAQVLSKQYDVEIVAIKSFTDVQEALAKADASGSSTRPMIAAEMSHTVCFAVIAAISMWCVAVINQDAATLNTLSSSTPWMIAVLGTPTAILLQYFGKRTKEKLSRYAMASGQDSPGLISTLAGVFKR